MSDRNLINENDLDLVVGGALRWQDGNVFPKDNPSAVYHYDNINACIAFIRDNWPGGALNEDTLKMLQQHGLVWQ